MSQPQVIYKANSWIKKNFEKSFTVDELASQNQISVSLFHQKFKWAIGMRPLQCQKRLRLTEARRLMIDEKQNVTVEACGICHGDSKIIEIAANAYPRIPGHEIVGKIVAVGSGVNEWHSGQWVGLDCYGGHDQTTALTMEGICRIHGGVY